MIENIQLIEIQMIIKNIRGIITCWHLVLMLN
jgi:hypothetical protein